MAIFGNFKGTTKSDFKIGKSGTTIFTTTEPVTGSNTGDLFLDSANSSIRVYDNGWKNIGETLPSLNVDEGTLFVDSANDTVSIGSMSSFEKLFVNGSLRLGTNPKLKFSGAFLDLQHTNGSTSQVRIRDNTSNTDPIFKVYTANNESEAFKVQGNTVHVGDTLRIADNGTGIEFTNVGALGNTDGALTVHSTGNLLISSGSDHTTAVSFDENSQDASFASNVSVAGDLSVDGTIQLNTVQTGVVSGVLFEPITDYGTISEQVTITIDFGKITEPAKTGDYEYINDIFGPTSDTFSVGNLPGADQPGQMIYVDDATGGGTMAFSDGQVWRRIDNRSVVS